VLFGKFVIKFSMLHTLKYLRAHAVAVVNNHWSNASGVLIKWSHKMCVVFASWNPLQTWYSTL